MVADANRLAALSTAVGRLDLALLLAAQGVRLADTPEAQDGLLAALAEHGRAERVIGFDGFPHQMNLTDEGRVLFLDRGPAVMALDPDGATAPRTVLEYPLDPQGELGDGSSPRRPRRTTYCSPSVCSTTRPGCERSRRTVP